LFCGEEKSRGKRGESDLFNAKGKMTGEKNLAGGFL